MTSVTLPTPIRSEHTIGLLGALVAVVAGMLLALTILLYVAAVGSRPAGGQAPALVTSGPPSSEQVLGEHAAMLVP